MGHEKIFKEQADTPAAVILSRQAKDRGQTLIFDFN